MKKYFLPVLILLILAGCKKETPLVIDDNTGTPSYDTAAIGNYFPVYPDSYWIYLDSNGDTIVHRTTPGYYLWSNYNPINNPYDTTKYYVTLYDSMAVVTYTIFVGSGSYHESGWETLLPDSIYPGKLFQKRYAWPNSYFSGKIKAMDTSMVINSFQYDSVVEVLEYYGPSLGILPYGKTFYAKHVGIIKKERCYYTSFDSILSEEYLINYSIGN